MRRTFALLSAALFTIVSLLSLAPGPRSLASAARATALLALTYPKPDGIRLAQSSGHTLPRAVRVRPGDTLTSIAARAYGSPRDWQALWWVNRRAVPNPDLIRAGQVLRLSAWHPDAPRWLAARAQAALPKPPAPVVASAATSNTALGTSSFAASGPWPGGAFGACVVARESGGNPQVMNSTGHYGLYQFAASTWAEYGGSPVDFGHASVAEQEQVFMNAIAAGGQGNWSAYDGC